MSDYELFQGMPTKVLTDHDIIDISGRKIEVLHTSGHSLGHLCFWEKAGDIYLQEIWYIKIFFLSIIRLLTPKHTLILWNKLRHCLLRKYFRDIIHWA